MVKSIFILFFAILLVYSCKNERTKPTEKQIKEYKEPLIKVNKQLVDKDIARIKGYYIRRKWDMTLTKAGLFYEIYKAGSGDTIKDGDIVEFNYKVDLLSGKTCYNSDELGTKSFRVGTGRVEKGLEKGILLLQKGSKARFIMAPFLAHGLIGDEKCITPLSTIIYDVEVIDVIRKNNDNL